MPIVYYNYNIHRALVTHENHTQHGHTYYVVLWLTIYTNTRPRPVWGRYTSLNLIVPNTVIYIITPRYTRIYMQLYLLCTYVWYTIASLPTLEYRMCIPVIGYLTIIYLVYLIMLIPFIPSCIANTISPEQVMREGRVNYLIV
jgi:hypothetical protein